MEWQQNPAQPKIDGFKGKYIFSFKRYDVGYFPEICQIIDMSSFPYETWNKRIRVILWNLWAIYYHVHDDKNLNFCIYWILTYGSILCFEQSTDIAKTKKKDMSKGKKIFLTSAAGVYNSVQAVYLTRCRL